ncbi:unnamed protein product [Didymodactylos carnosus]|uniref:Uncharacterized protein n=1 Tax=Didymodactylos carnosus TaxID=1234261 RepID=A0A8S2E8A0_9BILA|nr:unnamed protein product [Didymodactylos carnosus]CAF3853127.1 unnamed protein product [Didymodactylos carnosus]
MAAKVGDIDDEDNIMTTKIKLTHNEYNATIRNKLEFNRLKVIVKHINEQSDSASSKRRTMAHDLKKWLNDNQTIVCNTEEFFFNRQFDLLTDFLVSAGKSFDFMLFGRKTLGSSNPKVKIRILEKVFNERKTVYKNRVELNKCKCLLNSLNTEYEQHVAHETAKEQEFMKELRKEKSEQIEHFDFSEKDFYRFGVRLNLSSPRRNRQRPVGINSGFARPNRVHSAGSGLLNRPSTAPIKIYHGELSDDDTSDDEIIPIHIQSTTPNSRLTSAMRSTTTELSNYPPSISQQDYEDNKSSAAYSSTRISWPVKLRVFALQDEDEARKQWLAWKAEQRKAKRRSSKQFLDVELERQYRESIRRRQEIEAFLTPEIIENAKLHDPIFAKRYRQLKLAVKAGKLPAYDRNDTEINVTMTKSKIERARTALISAKQSKIKSIYRNQQIINDKNLSRRIDYFLTSLENLKKELGESV